MTTSLSTSISLAVAATLSKPLDLVSAGAPLTKTYRSLLASGTGAGKADLLFADTRTIAASGTDDLDLAGSLAGPLGDTLTMVRVKALIVHASSANTNNVLVGGAAATQFATWTGSVTDKVVLRPGATLALFAGDADATGYAVTASTGDLLRIANSSSGTGVDYDVVIVGCSA